MVWNPGDVVKCKTIILPDGQVVPCRESARVLAELPGWVGEIDYQNNTPEELIEVADFLVETTTDCPGWREDVPDDPVVPGTFTLPGKPRLQADAPGLVYM